MMRVKDLAYHRNGIGGMGFHVAIVEEDGRDMLVIRFPADADKKAGATLCAAFDMDKLGNRVIAFGENSYRWRPLLRRNGPRDSSKGRIGKCAHT